MENVVYLMGAGFSAPLGLPVMTNFLTKAKDIYAADSTRYAHFSEIFKVIDRMAKSKTYYSTDLTNIEEILSILEMEDQLTNRTNRDHASKYKKFIADVINHFDPSICPAPEIFPGNWASLIFSSAKPSDISYRSYGYFVGSLLNLALIDRTDRSDTMYYSEPIRDPECRYSVITLNYDRVIENFVEFFKFFSFILSPGRAPQIYEASSRTLDLPIAKLHGSVDKPDEIVPPTWNKLRSKSLMTEWKKAFAMLSAANHIRIVGYSLPTADAYIKYLLKSAVLESFNLKSIDVICLDPGGEAKSRYKEFIDFKNMRFANTDTRNYLRDNYDWLSNQRFERSQLSPINTYKLDLLEPAHANAMRAWEHA